MTLALPLAGQCHSFSKQLVLEQPLSTFQSAGQVLDRGRPRPLDPPLMQTQTALAEPYRMQLTNFAGEQFLLSCRERSGCKPNGRDESSFHGGIQLKSPDSTE
jgi:hypothetical protein